MIGGMAKRSDRKAEKGDMLSLLKRHEVQVLLRAGFGPKDVAERAGVARDTVRRIGREEPVSHVNDAAEHRARRMGRPPKAAAFTERVQGWLADEPELPTQELLRRAIDGGFTGAKSAFYSLVAGLRPARAAPVVRFEGLPGEFSQHDFGQVDVRFVDGTCKRVHFMASRLKYSRFAAVTVVPNERTETLVRTLVRHFHAFGGVPLLAVFDRPRTIVTKSGPGREVEVFNTMFAEVMLELGVGIEMCAPRSGNQKGAVEQLVKWVKNSFFKHRKFHDDSDLETQLKAWLHKVNHETENRATAEFPETRRQAELARLRPVRLVPEKLAVRVPAYVGPTAEVVFDTVAYSMPPRAANMPATIFLFEDRLRIVAGSHVAEHARRKRGDPPAALSEHRAAKLAAVHGRRAVAYEKRQQVLDLGPDALVLLTALLHDRPSRQLEDIDKLHALLDQHGEDDMRRALATIARKGDLSIHALRDALRDSSATEDGRASRPLRSGATLRPEEAPATGGDTP